MPPTVDLVFDQALQLSEDERLELIERLAGAVTAPTLLPEWADELDRRNAELETGAVVSVPAEEVFAQTRALIDSARR